MNAVQSVVAKLFFRKPNGIDPHANNQYLSMGSPPTD
jgi:hypothetical protein